LASEKDYYRHLIDQDVPEARIESLIGEGWTAFQIYQAEVEVGSIAPIHTPAPAPTEASEPARNPDRLASTLADKPVAWMYETSYGAVEFLSWRRAKCDVEEYKRTETPLYAAPPASVDRNTVLFNRMAHLVGCIAHAPREGWNNATIDMARTLDAELRKQPSAADRNAALEDADVDRALKWIDHNLRLAQNLMRSSVKAGNGYDNFAAHDAHHALTAAKSAIRALRTAEAPAQVEGGE
jgi:hypothetical protein